MFPKDLKVVKDEGGHVWLTNQEETLAYAKLMVPSEKDDIHNLLLKLPEVFTVLNDFYQDRKMMSVPSALTLENIINKVLSK